MNNNKVKLHCSKRHFIKYIRVSAIKGREIGIGVGGEGGKKIKREGPCQDRC